MKKYAWWLLLAGLALLPASPDVGAAAAPGAPAGAAGSACCGQLGNAGVWGGSSHFSLCIAGASCSSSANTQVSVTYTSSAPTCPSGYYDCNVTAGPLACGYSCQSDSSCSGFSPQPSCCSGWSGPGGCPKTQFRGCCGPREIIMPSGIQSASSEWIVAYGYKVK